MSLFRIEGLVKRFGGLLATDHVSLTVERGEVHALIGPNGAGKTTLVNLITGLLKADAGRILLDEIDITKLRDHQRVAAGMSRCFQVTRVFAKETVHDNLMLAAQAHAGSSLRFMAPRATERDLVQRAIALADRVGLGSERDRIAGTLPHGAQRALDVALALAAEPKLLLLDEPMAGMGPDESARMVELIESLRESMAILLIEHDMDAVFRLANRLTVLVQGPRADERHGRRSARASRCAGGVPRYGSRRTRMSTATTTKTLLEAKSIEAGYGASQVLFGIDLTIGAGEVLALLGRNGMGKSTLLKVLTGTLSPMRGDVQFGGAAIGGHKPDAIARRGVAIVPEGRHVFPNLSVDEHLRAFARPRPGSAPRWTVEALYGLFPRLAERKANAGNQLSGGEQQMLAIARALSTHPRLLILDEATEGLAPVIREEIWHCIATLKSEGEAILVVDKYVQRLLPLADRHVILERGRVVWRGDSAALDADRSLWTRYLGV
jgi:branched-chain amino acid transport system ATP-binding protein